MTAQKNITAAHPTIYAALAAAQAEMGPALKDSTNPAFRSKYADLANVCAACLPALNRHGIAVIQPPYDDDNGNRYVKTVFVHASGETLECRVPLIVGKNDMQGYGLPALNRHGIAVIQPPYDDDNGNRYVKTVFVHASGETLECRVPLIVGKNDMQGYGSAVTYARRYGLMAMAGIAPDDDDGNAAVIAAPAAPPKQIAKPVEKIEGPKSDPADELRDKMIRNLRAKGAGLAGVAGFKADLAELQKLSPEYAAQVEAEIQTQKAAA